MSVQPALRSFTLEADGARPLTINRINNLHPRTWAKMRSATRKRWADMAASQPAFLRAAITVTPLHRNRATPQDPAACAPEAKAAIDGLVDAGVLPDDSGRYVESITFLPPLVCGRDGMRLDVYEVP